jgi:hypothetical protein
MRGWRPDHPLKGESRRRANARAYAKVYVKRGRLKREPCQVCGSRKSQLHHPDHELPLLVVWLCRPCHLAWHAHWREMVVKAFGEWREAARAFAKSNSSEAA